MGHTVFYHGNCVDGYVSACNLKKALGDTGTPHFCPISYGRAVNFFKHYDIDSHIHTVWLINICLKASTLQDILDRGFNVVIIDTHKSSIDHISKLRNDESAKRLRFIIGTGGYCTASLISAIGIDTLMNIKNVEVGMPRVEVGYLDNGKLEAQFLTNISTKGFDRKRLTQIDRMLEAYELSKDTVSTLFKDGEALSFWMIQNDIQLEKPVADLNKIFAVYESHLSQAIAHGKIIAQAHKRVVLRALGAGLTETIRTADGSYVTINVSYVPDGLEDMFGDIFCHRNEGKSIAVAVLPNGMVNATSVSLRSTTVDLLPIAQRIHGGGDRNKAGTSLSGTHHSLHEIKYLIRCALQEAKEAIEESVKAA